MWEGDALVSSSASDIDDDPQFFADGARWDIAVGIAVAAILAWAAFGWQGAAVVLAVPTALLLVAVATLGFVVLTMWSVARNTQDALDGVDDE